MGTPVRRSSRCLRTPACDHLVVDPASQGRDERVCPRKSAYPTRGLSPMLPLNRPVPLSRVPPAAYRGTRMSRAARHDRRSSLTTVSVLPVAAVSTIVRNGPCTREEASRRAQNAPAQARILMPRQSDRSSGLGTTGEPRLSYRRGQCSRPAPGPRPPGTERGSSISGLGATGGSEVGRPDAPASATVNTPTAGPRISRVRSELAAPRPVPRGASAIRQPGCLQPAAPTPTIRSTAIWMTQPGGGSGIGGKRTSGPR